MLTLLLDDTQRATEETHEIMMHLAARLESVARPDNPCPKDQQNTKCNEPLPPALSNLNCILQSVHETNRRLRSIAERLET